MHTATSSASQYLIRFPEKIVACSQYALARLGVDRSRCLLKVDDFVLLCAPLQLGFRKAILMAALSAQELVHFQRYRNGIAGLSMEFALPNRTEPLKLFVRSTIAEIGQMKGRENVGLFIVDYKSTPDDLAVILGSYLEDQEKLGTQYEDYGQTLVKMTPEIAKVMGYNQYAVAADPSGNGRIQLFALSPRTGTGGAARLSALLPKVPHDRPGRGSRIVPAAERHPENQGGPFLLPRTRGNHGRLLVQEPGRRPIDRVTALREDFPR